MGLLSIFGKKTPKEKLEKQYKAALKAAFELSKTDRVKSDAKTAEADEIAKKIAALS